jgi:hypothetical protein
MGVGDGHGETIAEIIVFRDALSNADTAMLEAYLMDRFGIAR